MFWWRSSSTGDGEGDGEVDVGDKRLGTAGGTEKTETNGLGRGSGEGDGAVVGKPPMKAADEDGDTVTRGLDGISGSGEGRITTSEDDGDDDDGDDEHDGESCRDPGGDPPLDIATVTTEQMHRALERNRDHISWENIVLSAQKSGTLHVSHCMADFLREDEEEDGGGEESPSTRAALYLLGVSSELRQLRFRLVPSKMKEPVFWAGVFTILGLRDGGPASSAAKASVSPPSPEPAVRLPQDKQQPTSPRSTGIVPQRSSSTPYPTGAEVTSVEQLHALLRQKDSQISELLRQNAELKRTRSASGGDANAAAPPRPSCSKCGYAPPEKEGQESHHHPGKWIMDSDSIDFLNMDEQLKSNLRKEKQKRLDDVRNQMKFILDTDDVASTLGQWDCCKAMDYSAKGCAAIK